MVTIYVNKIRVPTSIQYMERYNCSVNITRKNRQKTPFVYDVGTNEKKLKYRSSLKNNFNR